MDVSVVIPIFNSQNILPEPCNQLKDALNSYKYEVILINDSSPDSSWSLIKEICENTEGIVVPANYNSNGQIVISGELQAVEKACEELKKNGAKKASEVAEVYISNARKAMGLNYEIADI